MSRNDPTLHEPITIGQGQIMFANTFKIAPPGDFAEMWVRKGYSLIELADATTQVFNQICVKTFRGKYKIQYPKRKDKVEQAAVYVSARLRDNRAVVLATVT